MGKTSKWLRSLLTGKKYHRDREKGKNLSDSGITPASPMEKTRWSFRRSSATPPASLMNHKDSVVVVTVVESEDDRKRHALAVAEASVAVADAAAAAAQAAAAVLRMTVTVEEAAAVKIQASFRSYLARKALRALKGLVKLQALVRGHLVRKQATATLRCMQALIILQAKARDQRIRMIQETKPSVSHTNIYHENDRFLEENIKIVEMDIQSKQYSNNSNRTKHDQKFQQYSPVMTSAVMEMSPRAYSCYFEDYNNSFTTAQNSPQSFRFKEYYNYNTDSLSSFDYPLIPNYMTNTESSRAKVRSQSVPKQRPLELYDRHPSGRRRVSMESSRNGVSRVVKMQRSSSQVGSTMAAEQEEHQHQYYPWIQRFS